MDISDDDGSRHLQEGSFESAPVKPTRQRLPASPSTFGGCNRPRRASERGFCGRPGSLKNLERLADLKFLQQMPGPGGKSQ